MNWKLIGHQWAVNLLQGHIEKDSIRHAYLITGPRSIGRRTLALRFTQALNCPHTGERDAPCFTCHTCQRIEKMEHPDLFPVQSQEESLVIRVDQIREVIHDLSLSNYEAPYRVALFLNFEEANDAAANALLKTLEEPPPQVVLILTAESPDNLLDTIVSRCEEIHLRPVPVTEIQKGLEDQYQLPPERAGVLAHISGGRPGYALKLHHHPEMETQRQQWLDDHDRLLAASRVERFAYAKKISQDADSLQEMIRIWQSYWRDIMLGASHAQSPPHNIDRNHQIDIIAKSTTPSQAKDMLSNLATALSKIEKYGNTQLTAEVLMLDLPTIKENP